MYKHKLDHNVLEGVWIEEYLNTQEIVLGTTQVPIASLAQSHYSKDQRKPGKCTLVSN